jgi:protein-disulfide isomerase
MHDAIYEHQANLTQRALVSLAEKLSLDTDRLVRELAEGAYRARVKEDFMSGVHSGVNGTPGFFIDGYRYDGDWNFETLSGALNAVLLAE